MSGVVLSSSSNVKAKVSRAEAASVARDAMTRQLLSGPVGLTLAKLAAPNVLAMLVAAATSIAEIWYASQLGKSGIVGLSLVFPLAMLMQMLSGGSIGGAAASSVARALGAGDVDRAERLILHIWIIACGAGLLIAVLMGLFGNGLFQLLGGTGEALEHANRFAIVLFPGGVAIWLCHMSLCIIRGTGNMALPSMVLLVASLIAIPLQGALTLGWGPFPRLELAGMALGSIIPFALAAVFSMGYIILGYAGLNVRNSFRMPKVELFWDVLKVGLIASVSSIQNILTAIVILWLVGRFGEDALAGFGLGSRLEFLMIPIIFGIGAAMTSMVGANIGAGQRERALSVGWTGAAAACLIIGSLGLFMGIYPDLWLNLFLGAEDVAAYEAGRSYFHTVAPFYAFFALGMSMFFASQGAGKVFWPVLSNIVRTLIALGGGYLFSTELGFGLQGVFIGVAAGLLIYGVMSWTAIRVTGWR